MVDLLQTLEATAVGTLVRESLYGFPILVGLHIMGLVCSVGMLIWFDLRLLGVSLGSLPASVVYRRVMVFVVPGFMLMAATGALLFVGYASSAWENAFFRVKLAAMLLAGMNAAFYHAVTERSAGSWEHLATPPTAARLAGAASLLLWAIVIVSGRMMAYTMY
jgi:hypothetical protein